MEKASSDGKSNVSTDNPPNKGKAESSKKEVQHGRVNKVSSQNKHHIRGTASQSTIEYAKSGEQTKSNNSGQRSKSFLEESALFKALPCGQGVQCCKRGTHGSHGDGLFYPVSSSHGKRSGLTEVSEKREDVSRKQVPTSLPPSQSTGVITQRLFESSLSFADLVRKGEPSTKVLKNRRIQLNNTLLSTPQGSTEVSNYLNKYRSYLDNLRRTYSNENSRFEDRKSCSTFSLTPQFLPLTHMIHDLSEVSKDDPDFQKLLEKTTTDSIRNLWPQTGQSQAQYNSVVCEIGQISNPILGTIANDPRASPGGQSETPNREEVFANANLPDDNVLAKTDCSDQVAALGASSSTEEHIKDTSGEETTNKVEMKSCGDVSVYPMGENAEFPSSGNGKSFHNLGHETAPMNNNDSGVTSVLSSQPSYSSNWGDGGVRANDSCLSFKLQNQSALDNLLKHQQILLQRKQLQKQNMAQSQHHHHHHHHHQQQQRQQQEQQQMQTMFNKNEKDPHGMAYPCTSSPFLNSTNSSLTPSLCQGQTFNNGPMQPMGGLFSLANESKTRTDLSHIQTTYGDIQTDAPVSHVSGDNHESQGVQGSRACPRTLKASYACLDPSSPMTFLPKPVNDTDFPEGVDNNLYSSHFSSLERRTSDNQLAHGDYNAGDKSDDNAWSRYQESITDWQGRQHDQPDGQAFLAERFAKPKVASCNYDFNPQVPWSDSNPIQQRPIIKMNSDSSLGCRLASQSFSRQADGAISNAGCFSALGPASTDHQMTSWTGYQQNVNTNRTMAGAADAHNGRFLGDNVPFDDSNTFGNSRLRQWRSPAPQTADSKEYQDTTAPGSRLGFPKHPQVELPAAFHHKGQGQGQSQGQGKTVPCNPSCWNSASQTSKISVSGPIGLVSSQAPSSAVGALGMASCFQGQNSRYHHLFNSNNASSDTLGLLHAADNFSYLKTSGNGDCSDQYPNPYTNPGPFQNRRTIPEAFDSGQGMDCMTSSAESQNLTQQANTTPADERPAAEQQAQKIHGYEGEDKIFDNQHDAVHIKEDLPRSSSTTNLRLQQNKQTSLGDVKRECDESVLNKLSENLEKTSLSANNDFGITVSPPWYELAPAPNEFEYFKTKQENSKIAGFHRNTVYPMDLQQTIDQSLSVGTDNKTTQVPPKTETDAENTFGYQSSHRPRMILGVNALKVATDAKESHEADDGNKKLKEMLGIGHTAGESARGTILNNTGNTQPSKIKSGYPGEPSPPFQAPSSLMAPSTLPHGGHGNQLPHVQMSGNRMPMNVSQQMKQMYCVSNVLLPPPGQGHQANLVSASGVMTNVGSSSRVPHGLMRVPFVDMSRFVYVQPFPVNVTPSHTSTNNNHNNSSSSNPHVNTSNIITINTSENDFSANGDRAGRGLKPGGGRGKSNVNRMRAAADEFPIPVYGMRTGEDAPMSKGVKVRAQNTNPWDQDLEHDFSSTLFSKIKKIDHGNMNSEVGFMYPEMMCSQQGNNAVGLSESRLGGSSFMQWPITPDMHPEMLDMLAIKRPVTDECANGRLGWPDMEFVMSSNRDQLQAVRKSNKPLGSNKANLISILPKGRTVDSCDVRCKDTGSMDKLASTVK